MQRIWLLILINLTIGLTHTISADEGLSLQDAVQRFADSRRNIRTYDVSISADVIDAAEPVLLTNGETSTPTERLVAFTLEVVANVREGKILVARLDRMENIESGRRENRKWKVWVSEPHQAIDKTYRVGRVLSGGSRPKFFDPLALGLGFGSEYRRGDALSRIVQNYSRWPPWKSGKVERGLLRFGSKDAVYLEFDSEKDCSPVALHSKGESSMPFEVKISLSKIAGNWLPKTAAVVSEDQQQQLIFTWHSVNESVEPRFSLDDIANRYQIKNLRPF